MNNHLDINEQLFSTVANSTTGDAKVEIPLTKRRPLVLDCQTFLYYKEASHINEQL